jgi:hypothetical protein
MFNRSPPRNHSPQPDSCSGEIDALAPNVDAHHGWPDGAKEIVEIMVAASGPQHAHAGDPRFLAWLENQERSRLSGQDDGMPYNTASTLWLPQACPPLSERWRSQLFLLVSRLSALAAAGPGDWVPIPDFRGGRMQLQRRYV